MTYWIFGAGLCWASRRSGSVLAASGLSMAHTKCCFWRFVSRMRAQRSLLWIRLSPNNLLHTAEILQAFSLPHHTLWHRCGVGARDRHTIPHYNTRPKLLTNLNKFSIFTLYTDDMIFRHSQIRSTDHPSEHPGTTGSFVCNNEPEINKHALGREAA